MPMTKQKHPHFARPFRWWLYIPVVLVLIITISVASSVINHREKSSLEVIENSAKMVYLSSSSTTEPTTITRTPVIGILTQVLRDYKKFSDVHKLHIAASYVKWLESAGAQVVPILLNQNDLYYEQMFKQTNGLLFPGGDNLLDPNKSTPMMVAAKKLFKLAVEANDNGDYYPIWGTCLGLELLSVLPTNQNVLDSCDATDDALAMNFTARGKLFAPASYNNIPLLNEDYSGIMMHVLNKAGAAYNYHKMCLTDEGLKQAGLSDFYRPLAYSNDRNGKEFIAILEAIKYPIFAVQFHPEKPSFEFVAKSKQHNIPHSREAIAASRYFADFFVRQAQLNGHTIDRALMDKNLIYAHTPMYTALVKDMYEQRYLFPFGSDFSAGSTEEFAEHVLEDGEEVPEKVTKNHSNGKGTNGNGKANPMLTGREVYTVETAKTEAPVEIVEI